MRLRPRRAPTGPLLGRWSSPTRSLGWLALLGLALGCGPADDGAPSSQDPTSPSSAETEAGPGPSAEALFDEIAVEVGLDFTHFNGMSGSLLYSEMMGSGVALFDVDNDGDLDVYLVQGAMLTGTDPDATAFPPRADDRPPRDRLFRNDLTVDADGSPDLRFTDITDASGLTATGYGMGVAVFDADGDGWLDLYLTNAGRNQLWRNLGAEGDGVRFADVSAGSGADLDGWSVPAIPFDADGDGRLDLFVGRYVDYRPESDKPCTDELGQANYCGPLAYPPQADRLLHNLGPDAQGQPRFADITRVAGLGEASPGACLGAAVADFDGDGRMDLYVANDGTPNHLWMNQGPGGEGPVHFAERAVLAGAAVSGLGHPEASMGTATADLDQDGDAELFVTHLNKETNTLYLNEGQGFFRDLSDRSGLGPPSLPRTGFGTGFLDVDNDGRLDAFVANGAVKILKELALAGDPHPLHQPNQLFLQQETTGGPRFEPVDHGGAALALSAVSRGVAVGDVDNDGDADLLVGNNSGPVHLLRNRVGQEQGWVGLRLAGDSGLAPVGTRVELLGATPRHRTVAPVGSYASSGDPRVLFGLGPSETAAPSSVRVRWPDGVVEEWTDLAPGRYHTLTRGTGRPANPENTP